MRPATFIFALVLGQGACAILTKLPGGERSPSPTEETASPAAATSPEPARTPEQEWIAKADEAYPIYQILDTLRDLADKGGALKDPTDYHHPALELENFVKAAGLLASAEQLAGACAKLEAAGQPLPTGGRTGMNDAEDAERFCQWAKQPKPLLVRALRQRLSWEEAHWESIAEDVLADAKEHGRVDPDRYEDLENPERSLGERRADYEPAFRAFGEAMPSPFFAAYLKNLKLAAKALKGAEDKSLYAEANEKNRAIEAVAKRIAKTIPAKGWRYVGYAVWRGTDVQKNELGMPLYKYRTVRVVVQGPKESFCRGYDVITQSDYMGHGTYGEWYFLERDGLEKFNERAYDRGRCK